MAGLLFWKKRNVLRLDLLESGDNRIRKQKEQTPPPPPPPPKKKKQQQEHTFLFGFCSECIMLSVT